MSKTIVIIAEKPSVAKLLAAWLAKEEGVAARPVGRSHIEVGAYRVSWLFGHVLENVAPHQYDVRYKAWVAADLPIIPSTWKLVPKAEAAAQIAALKGLLADADGVIGLGDPDQEGQLLQDEFLLWARCKAPVRRLWLSATDDVSIARAWKDMKPNEEYAGYYWSALARSHADWLAGINLSRACTLASQRNGGNATLSVGRVQTPTLALIVGREREILGFKPVNYFTPFIHLSTTPGFKAVWSPDKQEDDRLDGEGRLLDRKVAEAIAASCRAGSAVVKDVKSTKGKVSPPLPFSLSTLQEHLSRKYGMGVQDALKHAQALYEKKIASYPRTDCEYLPESQHGEARSLLAHLGMGIPGLGTAPAAAAATLKSKAFNDKRVTAHHAIVPRPATLAQIADLSSTERLVWVEVAKRYLLQFFPDAEFLSTEIVLECASEPFKASGKVYTIRGWKDAFSVAGEADDEPASAILPLVVKGAKLAVGAAGVDSTTTKPPKRFTEGTLVGAMKAVHRFVRDPKLKAVLRDNVGIGTEATRANVIGELFGRKFISLEKKEIVPTSLGTGLVDALPLQISAPDMTALWQQAMDDIRKTGKPGYADFIKAQALWLSKLISEVPDWFVGKSLSTVGGKAGSKGGLEVVASGHTCAKCGAALNHIKGKYGWFFGCANADCNASYKDVAGKPVEKAVVTESGPVTIAGVGSDSACPKCKKGKMKVRTCGPATGTPGKQFLSCSNFFEKGAKKCVHSVWPNNSDPTATSATRAPIS